MEPSDNTSISNHNTDTENSIEKIYEWLKFLTGNTVIPTVVFLTILGINQQSFYANSFTYPVNVNCDNQSIDQSEMIVLPNKYGKFFESIEKDKDLINYYQNTYFFDEKDFQ